MPAQPTASRRADAGGYGPIHRRDRHCTGCVGRRHRRSRKSSPETVVARWRSAATRADDQGRLEWKTASGRDTSDDDLAAGGSRFRRRWQKSTLIVGGYSTTPRLRWKPVGVGGTGPGPQLHRPGSGHRRPAGRQERASPSTPLLSTPKRKFIIADTRDTSITPWRMVTGASTAQLVIVLVVPGDLLEQSRRRAAGVAGHPPPGVARSRARWTCLAGIEEGRRDSRRNSTPRGPPRACRT